MTDVHKQASDILTSIHSKFTTNIKSSIKIRGHKRISTTKTLQALDQNFPSDETELKLFFDKLSEGKKSLSDLDSTINREILDLEVVTDEQFYILSDACDSYLDRLNMHLTSLKLSIENLTCVQRNSRTEMSQKNVQLKLPTAKLPEFDGTPEAYDKFIESLDEILNKFNLTQFEKYNYLLQQVQSTAKDIVQSVPRSNNCYDTAKQLLSDAFCNKYLQQTSVIKKLIKLKLNRSNRYAWISEVRTLIEQMRRLEINSECFAHFFLWGNMDEQFKKEFMMVTNNSQPDLNLLMDNAFTVFNRVEELSNNLKGSTSSAVLATNVQAPSSANKATAASQGKKLVCQLCSSIPDCRDINHSIINCKRFDTNAKRVAKIKELRGCLRCGALNHNRFCKVKLPKNCSYCAKSHESYLCFSKVTSSADSSTSVSDDPKNTSGSRPSRNSEGKAASVVGNTHALQYSVMNVNSDCSMSNVLLPTFTAAFPHSDLKARCLYDTASQLSFVTERLANKFKFPVVQNDVKIQINGFNESKVITSKLVSVQLRLNGTVRSFEAVVIPTIRSTVDSSELEEVVTLFKSNNIDLADKTLTLDDGRIDILLGANAIQVLPVQSCIFGENEKSLFFYTCEGVMLSGRVNNLRHNASNLGLLKNFISKIRSTF